MYRAHWDVIASNLIENKFFNAEMFEQCLKWKSYELHSHPDCGHSHSFEKETSCADLLSVVLGCGATRGMFRTSRLFHLYVGVGEPSADRQVRLMFWPYSAFPWVLQMGVDGATRQIKWKMRCDLSIKLTTTSLVAHSIWVIKYSIHPLAICGSLRVIQGLKPIAADTWR